ncbi:MAG: hypothetical protein D6722_28745 [Bacteroidetes bacterium]|nr:MAG: hypothetical protein D6722_28745 [Bacteroidota bacterium]
MYRYFGTQTPDHLRALRGAWDPWLAQVETLSSEDPLKGVMLAELHAKRAILEFLDGNYLTSVRYARSSRVLIKRQQKDFPDNTEQYKILGLFNVLLGAVPRTYKWITETLGFAGDLRVGVQHLEKAAAEGQLMSWEASILLSYVEKNMLEQPEQALLRMQRLQQQSPASPLLDYLVATALMGEKRNDQAIDLLQQQAAGVVSTLPHWGYQLGKAYAYRNDLPGAQRYLAAFLRDYEGGVFRADAYFRLGMALTLDGKYALGRYFFSQVGGEAPHSHLDGDAYARHMAERFARQAPTPFHQALFRARNFFDGGYHDQAVVVLQGTENSLAQQPEALRIEWHYRMGRIFHARGDLPQAESHYARCIGQADDAEARWMQAYAWYYRGEVAHSQGQPELARTCWEQALGFEDYFYQNGLENRCRAALAALRAAGR